MLNGDVANSLGATALVTNAYLYSGEDKYKQWVLDYTDAWMERMRRNNGIVPDNVGPTGKIGENRQGNWWGGLYGWNSYCGFNILFHSLTIAAECALLLSGDAGYLDLLRSQIKVLLDNAITREDGQLLLATRRTPAGWGYHLWDPSPERGRLEAFRLQELAHLYHASMAAEDYALIERDTGDRPRARLERGSPSKEKKTTALRSWPAFNTTTARIQTGPRRFYEPSTRMPRPPWRLYRTKSGMRLP